MYHSEANLLATLGDALAKHLHQLVSRAVHAQRLADGFDLTSHRKLQNRLDAEHSAQKCRTAPDAAGCDQAIERIDGEEDARLSPNPIDLLNDVRRCPG